MEENINELSNEELVHIARMTTIGTPSGMRAQKAQAELKKRLMESINNLNKETGYYSQKLIDLTIVLFVIGLMQLFVTIKTITDTWVKWIWVCVVAMLLIYIFIGMVFKNKDKKKNK